MELEREYGKQRLERKLKWTQDMMLSTLLGLLGFFLGLIVFFMWAIGLLLLWYAFFLRYAAYAERDNPDRSDRIHTQRLVIAAFGFGTILGSVARIVVGFWP
ncbi:MAG: hypothetical protein JSV43_00685 [Methanobacteriota archaeon]|nr:MAG: hypothetical protein JSV43_00685 [Euryarchaeota archaeon]